VNGTCAAREISSISSVHMWKTQKDNSRDASRATTTMGDGIIKCQLALGSLLRNGLSFCIKNKVKFVETIENNKQKSYSLQDLLLSCWKQVFLS